MVAIGFYNSWPTSWLKSCMIFVSQSDLEQMLPMREAVEVTRKGFCTYQASDWDIPLRSMIPLSTVSKSMLLMPVYSHRHRRLYTKTVLVHTEAAPHRGWYATAVCTVWDGATGAPLLGCDGTYATALRTAAASGLAAKLTARPSSRIAVLIGAGYQGQFQLDAVASLFHLEKAFVVDRSTDKAVEVAKWGAGRWKIEVAVANSTGEAVRQADIVLAATDSLTPVFDGHDLQPGTHVSSIGSYRPDMRELDEVALRGARVVVDSEEHTPKESGDVIDALSEGTKLLGDLAWLVRNPGLARQSDADITVYKSAGFGLLDALLMETLYDMCLRSQHIGAQPGVVAR